MKKLLFAFLAIAALVLVSCATAPKEETVVISPLFPAEYQTESYRSDEEWMIINDAVENRKYLFQEILRIRAPYVLQDAFTLKGALLSEITIPVFSTKAVDSNGNFIFTITKHNVVKGSLTIAAESFKITVNAKKYDLKANETSLFRFLTVDLTPYGIQLGEDEVLGFGDQDDTISMFAASASNTSFLKEIGEVDPLHLGYFSERGKGLSNGVLLLDFKWVSNGTTERKEEEDAYYEQLAARLKEKFDGKYISIIGDSISTYGGITNNTDYNKSLQGNRVYYALNSDRMPSSSFMYWARLADDLGLKYCVMNAYSGSYIYGKASFDFKDAGVVRCVELDNDNKTPNDSDDDINPDLILVFIGVNDMHGLGIGKATEINDMVEKAAGNEDTMHSLFEAWFNRVLESTSNATDLRPNTTYTTFDQVYALMIYRITQKYPDATVLCMDFMGNHSAYYTANTAKRYGQTVREVAKYFGVEYLPWSQAENFIDVNTSRFLTADGAENALHPNAYGHLLMERQILSKLAEIE